jgi:hypothetical protein
MLLLGRKLENDLKKITEQKNQICYTGYLLNGVSCIYSPCSPPSLFQGLFPAHLSPFPHKQEKEGKNLVRKFPSCHRMVWPETTLVSEEGRLTGSFHVALPALTKPT